MKSCRVCSSDRLMRLPDAPCDRPPDMIGGPWWRCVSCGSDSSEARYADVVCYYDSPEYADRLAGGLSRQALEATYRRTSIGLVAIDERCPIKHSSTLGSWPGQCSGSWPPTAGRSTGSMFMIDGILGRTRRSPHLSERTCSQGDMRRSWPERPWSTWASGRHSCLSCLRSRCQAGCAKSRPHARGGRCPSRNYYESHISVSICKSSRRSDSDTSCATWVGMLKACGFGTAARGGCSGDHDDPLLPYLLIRPAVSALEGLWRMSVASMRGMRFGLIRDDLRTGQLQRRLGS